MIRVPCPRCGTEIDLAVANPNRPFCSDRCRNVDLHAWTSDQYRIDGDAPATDDPALLNPASNGNGHHHN